MPFYSLPTGKLHKKQKLKDLKKYLLAMKVGFIEILVIRLINSNFQREIINDAPSGDVKNYLLATSNFGKGMQDDINMHVRRDSLNSASFRQKLNPISKNIFRKQNPLELVFKDISTINA